MKAEPAGEKISRRMLSPGPETWFREEYPPVRNRGPLVLYSNEQRRRVKRCHVYLETPKGWHGVSQHRYADQCFSKSSVMVVSSQQVTKYGRHLSYLPILLIFCTLPEILTAQHDVLALHWVASWVVYMISLQVRRAACAISHTSISPFS